MRSLLAVMVAAFVAVGCARNPVLTNSVPNVTKSDPSPDIVARFVSTASKVQVFGRGLPRLHAGGSSLLFVLHVGDVCQRRPLPESYMQISEDEMKKVIGSLAAAGFFELSEKATPDSKDWHLAIYGPLDRVERYCTLQQFEEIANGISKVLPKGFTIGDR